jgi:hypothetical protein
MILLAIPLTSVSLRSGYEILMLEHGAYHCEYKSGEARMVPAMRAPWMGGFEYMGRMIIFS